MDLSETVSKLQVPANGNGLDGAAEVKRLIRDANLAVERNRALSVSSANMKRAAIPERFVSRTLETFVGHCPEAARALRISTDYASTFDVALKTGRSLIFAGGVGAGKTHLAAGIANRILKNGRTALFASVISAIRSVKETYRRDSEVTESQAIANLVRPDLLILDEVGVQFGTEAEKIIMFEIINGRYESMRPTIVISNLDKDELTVYLGERVVDRLREGGGQFIVFDWPSYRRLAG